MAGVPITDLPTVTSNSAADVFPIVQSGVTSQIAFADVTGLTQYATAGDTTGANLIGYLQDGTQAVGTTVQAALRRIIFIEDFGADPATGANFSQAVNKALAFMSGELQAGQAGLVGGLITTSTPGVKWIATVPLVYSGINNQVVEINGSIDATALANGTTFIDFGASYCEFNCSGHIYGPGTGASNADFIKFTNGAANKIVLNEVESFRYGFYFPNTGGSSVAATENQIYYRVLREMRRHIYAPTPSGASQAYEGTRFFGGLLLNAVSGCVKIEASVNMNYSRISGGIDSGGGGIKDYENLSTTSGLTLDLDYLHDPSYYTLGSKDTLINGPVNGFDLTGVDSSAPAVRVRQVTPYSIPASLGKASHYVYAGDAQDGSTMQGAIVGSSYTLAGSSATGLFSGYISNAAASSGWTAFTAGLGRATADNTAVLGSGTYYTRRASSNLSDVVFKNASLSTVGKFYSEGDRVNLPQTYTPASAADAYGTTGDITKDATYLYVKAASGWRGVYTLPVGQINETVESSATAVTMATNNTYQDITSISLTAGTWIIDGLVNFEINTATCTAAVMGISTTSGNSAAGLTNGNNKMGCREPTASTNSSATVAGYIVSPGSTTTYYLKALNTFSAGNPLASGRITARRIA
jgi:hypothetical protein